MFKHFVVPAITAVVMSAPMALDTFKTRSAIQDIKGLATLDSFASEQISSELAAMQTLLDSHEQGRQQDRKQDQEAFEQQLAQLQMAVVAAKQATQSQIKDLADVVERVVLVTQEQKEVAPAPFETLDPSVEFSDGDEVTFESLVARVVALEAEIAELKRRSVQQAAGSQSSKNPVYPSVSGVSAGGSSGNVASVRYAPYSGFWYAPYSGFYGSSGGNVASVSRGSYSPRWFNNDGRTARNHAVQVHGFDPSLSDDQLAILHDQWHDQYGSAHSVSSSYVSSGYAPVVSSVITSSPRRSYSTTSVSTCPPGGCPVGVSSTVVTKRGGLLSRIFSKR